jgi:hypothetical protein
MRLRLALAATVLTAHALAAQTIDTRGNANQTVNGPEIIGQRFTAPTDAAALTAFTFFVGAPLQQTYDYRTSLYAFGESGPVGTALYTSEVRSASGGLTPQLFTVGSIAVTPGASYFALVVRTIPGQLTLGLADDSPPGIQSTYANGELYIAAFTADPVAASYNSFTSGDDLMFVGSFAPSTVPEPSALALVAGGLFLLLTAGRRIRPRIA